MVWIPPDPLRVGRTCGTQPQCVFLQPLFFTRLLFWIQNSIQGHRAGPNENVYAYLARREVAGGKAVVQAKFVSDSLWLSTFGTLQAVLKVSSTGPSCLLSTFLSTAGAEAADVQEDCQKRQEGEGHTAGSSFHCSPSASHASQITFVIGQTSCTCSVFHKECCPNNELDASWSLQILYQDLQSKELPNTRIQPDRRWFGNTRVVGQKQLEQFREQMSSKVQLTLKQQLASESLTSLEMQYTEGQRLTGVLPVSLSRPLLWMSKCDLPLLLCSSEPT